MDVDPDYAGFAVNATDDEDLNQERSRILQENARDAAVDKIRTIIDEQFSKEIEMKEDELMAINQKLADARSVMDRLRACVVASFYAASFTKRVDGAKGPDAGAAYHPAIQNVMRKAVTSVLSKKTPPPCQPTTKKQKDEDREQEGEKDATLHESTLEQDDNDTDTILSVPVKTKKGKRGRKKTVNITETTTTTPTKNITQNLGGRQRIKKTIIVGNVSKYIPPELRESTDKSTHKWMVYVRGNRDEPRIDHFVRKVWFFLHPSYRPNDLVEVCEAPFHLTRRGWGEFPVRVQIHFCDRRNRPVDIIHGLRLDRTYTGLQTLGAETVCEVELDRSSVQPTVDDILDVTALPDFSIDNLPAQEEKENVFEKTENAKLLTSANNDDIYEEKDEVYDSNEKNASSDINCEDRKTPITESSTRKRKNSQDKNEISVTKDEEFPDEEENKNMEISHNNKVDSPDNEIDLEEEISSTPQKKRRKRRRDSCRVSSASEDDMLSDTNTTDSLEKSEMKKKDTESKSVDISVTLNATTSSKSDQAETDKSQDIECEDSTKDVSAVSSDSKCSDNPMETVSNIPVPTKAFSLSDSSDPEDNFKQPIVVLPRSEVSGNGFFRVRSASTGDGLPARSCASLIKSGHSITPVLNVKLNPFTSQKSEKVVQNLVKGDSQDEETTVLDKSAEKFLGSSSAVFQPVVNLTSMQNEKSTNVVHKLSKTPIAVPLTSLLKTGEGKFPQVLKFVQPLPKGATLSVNMETLSGQTTAKRDRRSLSADQSQVKSLTLKPLNIKSGSSQTPLQFHIISTAPKQNTIKKFKTTELQSPVTLQTLQAALSSGNLSISTLPSESNHSKTKIQTDSSSKNIRSDLNIGQQYVLATVFNPKGKQQLAFINPSTLGTKKIVKISGNKVPVSTVKQAPQAKPTTQSAKERRSSQHEQNVTPKIIEPIHVRLGNQIQLNNYISSLVDDILPLVVKTIPLVNENKNVTEFPFCAATESDFLEWNVGKQRASEWQRAVLVQKVLKYIQAKNEKLQECKVPSKKFIMNWCLRHGYSIFTDEYEEENEDMEVDEKQKEKSELFKNLPFTISNTENLMKLLDSKKEEKVKHSQNFDKKNNDDDVIFVDVVNVDKPPSKVLDIKVEPEDAMDIETSMDGKNKGQNIAKIQSLTTSPEIAVVEEITRKTGFYLQKCDGIPTTHIVLAEAMKQFADSLLRKSLCASLIRRDGKSMQRVAPQSIDVLDVTSAIRETSVFDFLTDINTASSS